ncbi:MAG: CARDB domain-containing protein [Sandaracinaceae bacterium]
MRMKWFALALFLIVPYAAGCDCEGPLPNPDGGGDAEPIADGAMPMVDADGVDASSDAGPPDSGTGPVCGDLTCGVGERCEEDPPTCVANTCEDLACSATERCEPAPTGDGNVCVDISCDDAVDCEEDEYCDTTVGACAADACVPGVRICGATGLEECAADGSASEVRFTCGSDAYFTSECTDDAGAFCPCRDDWDCPADTVCDVDRCVGTGVAPTCRLPPAPFSEVLPTPEAGFPWGGTSRSTADAPGSPFPSSAQVVVTPLVANLDDDNGDGLIDERDFPEIIFMTFNGANDPDGTRYSLNGTLRAVHGGGANRGGDFFASCGSTVWNEGDDVSIACARSSAILDPTSTAAVGDIDGDGVPEIVAMTENNRVQVYSNTGVPLVQSPTGAVGGNQAVSIANIDGAGFAEIIVGNRVWTMDRDTDGDFVFLDRFDGSLAQGNNGQGPISCVADLDGDGRQEVIAGSSVYRFPRAPAGVTRTADCTGSESDPDEMAFCDGDLLVLWDGVEVNGAPAIREGFCAVADVWGTDSTTPPGPSNALDGMPEVVVVADGRIQIFEGATGILIDNRVIDARTDNGGAPNIDDFDGDGFPEIGTAFRTGYALTDLQPATAMCPAWTTPFDDGVTGLQGNTARTPPGTTCATAADCGDTTQFTCNAATSQCVCLHNGWERETEDDSSRVTGSSVFDFNGDGSAEVVYNDECFFRVYAGIDGSVFFKEPSRSRTRTENPIAADVDNDGNAEIVFATTNESGLCSLGDSTNNNGIEVWGDASDAWVGARRIYNQHSYHVTNVFESGGIPLREPESWRPWNGRLYNSYRSQPRSFGVAPDLTIGGVQVTSRDAGCGALSGAVDITVRVVNAGDVRVGPDIEVSFRGEWDAGPVMETLYADGAMTPLTTTLGRPLEPGGEVFVTVMYDPTNNSPGTLPDRVEVLVDEADAERECLEDNNTRTQPLTPEMGVADLVIELGAVGGDCPMKTFETTVRNEGSVEVRDVVVRYYAGDPSAGGSQIHEETVAGPIAPGGSETFTATVASFPGREVIVFAVVDPDDAIVECNDGNNTAMTDRVECPPIIF